MIPLGIFSSKWRVLKLPTLLPEVFRRWSEMLGRFVNNINCLQFILDRCEALLIWGIEYPLNSNVSSFKRMLLWDMRNFYVIAYFSVTGNCGPREETNLIYRQPQPNPVKHGLVKWGRVLYRLQVRIVSESWRCQRRLPGWEKVRVY